MYSFIIVVCILGAFILLNTYPKQNSEQPISEVPPISSQINSTKYTDGKTEVAADFNLQERTVTFTHPSLGTTTLPEAISASGARYASQDETTVFWEHQGELIITSQGKDIFKGKVVSSDFSEVHSELIDNTWVWQKTQMSDDSIITPNQATAFSLTFTEDGQVSGTTDCNSFRASYTADKNTITLSQLASTMMFCENSQESIFTKELSNVSGYMINDAGDLILSLAIDSGEMHFIKQ